MALLDRYFVSDKIEDKFPICKVTGFPFTLSDHCPILLTCEFHRAILKRILGLKRCGFWKITL